MALDPTQARHVADHLRALRFAFPEMFLSDDAAIATAIAAATAGQCATILDVLADIDRMKGSLQAIDSRFKARAAGKVQLNPTEWPQRVTQYQWFCIQMGAVLKVIEPLGSFVSDSDPQRGWRAMPTPGRSRAFDNATAAAAKSIATLADPIIAALASVVDRFRSNVADGLRAWLASVTDPAATYTPAEYKRTLGFLRGAFQSLDQMVPAITAALIEHSGTAGDLAFAHLTEQLGLIADGKAQPVAISAAVRSALAKQFRVTAIDSVAGLADSVRALLAQGVAAKETIEQLVARLEGLDPESAVEQLAVSDWIRRAANAAAAIARAIAARAASWFDRLVHTEIMDAYHQHFDDALRDAARATPDIKRRWDARLDSNVCPICAALDGQVRAIGEQFDSNASDAGGSVLLKYGVAKLLATTKFDAPPAHPRCVCFLTVFRPGWSQEGRPA